MSEYQYYEFLARENDDTAQRLRVLREDHARKPSFLARLDKAGLR